MEQRHYYFDPRADAELNKAASMGGTSYFEAFGGALANRFNNLYENTANAVTGILTGDKARSVVPIPDDNSASTPYRTFYNVKAVIEQYDFDGRLCTARYILHNVFPTNVSAVSYDYSSVDTLLECTVTFACSHFQIQTAKGNRGLEDYMDTLVRGGRKLIEQSTDYLKNLFVDIGTEYATDFVDDITGSIAGNFGDYGADVVRTIGKEVTGALNVAADAIKTETYGTGYRWNKQEYVRFNEFRDSNSQTGLPDLDMKRVNGRLNESYWRSYELARWDNIYNRWREIGTNGNQKSPGGNNIGNTVAGAISGAVTDGLNKAGDLMRENGLDKVADKLG